jgi:hypothetical protein
MTSRPPFEDREKGYERDFAHGEELKFREHALRNRLLAEWAASRAGLSHDAATRYVSSIFEEGTLRADDRNLVKKIAGDIIAAGTPASEADVWDSLRRFAAQAHKAVAETDK